MPITTIPTRTISDPASATDINTLMANEKFLQGAKGFLISGDLTTSSTLADVTVPCDIELANIIFDVGTAVATADMTIDVTYGTNPASKATLFATTKPKIVNGATTSTDGVLTTTSLVARGHLTVTLSGTFTGAKNLTMWLVPVLT